jgi:hypothetical protein
VAVAVPVVRPCRRGGGQGEKEADGSEEEQAD